MKLRYTIPKPADLIFEYLTNMDKFASIHPVISRIEKRRGESYLVYETLKLGFIPVSFTYPVAIESDRTALRVVMNATVMKLTKIQMTYSIREENGASIVEEEILFHSILPIKGIMEKIFRTQHAQFFKSIGEL